MRKRVAVLVLASVALGACSAVPDWARPSNVADRLLGREPAPATNQFPSVGDVPRQAPATTTPSQRQATIAGLAADRFLLTWRTVTRPRERLPDSPSRMVRVGAATARSTSVLRRSTTAFGVAAGTVTP